MPPASDEMKLRSVLSRGSHRYSIYGYYRLASEYSTEFGYYMKPVASGNDPYIESIDVVKGANRPGTLQIYIEPYLFRLDDVGKILTENLTSLAELQVPPPLGSDPFPSMHESSIATTLPETGTALVSNL